jgi:hypothetical protein
MHLDFVLLLCLGTLCRLGREAAHYSSTRTSAAAAYSYVASEGLLSSSQLQVGWDVSCQPSCVPEVPLVLQLCRYTAVLRVDFSRKALKLRASVLPDIATCVPAHAAQALQQAYACRNACISSAVMAALACHRFL